MYIVATCPQLELTLPKEQNELGHFNYDLSGVQSTGSSDVAHYWVNTKATWSCNNDGLILYEFVCQENGTELVKQNGRWVQAPTRVNKMRQQTETLQSIEFR